MMARFLVCTSLLAALVLLSTADAAQGPRVLAPGYGSTAAAYLASADGPLPRAVEPSPRPLHDTNGEAILDSPGIASELCSPDDCGPDVCGPATCGPDVCGPDGCETDLWGPDVWTEEPFIHHGPYYAQGWIDQGFTLNPASPQNRFNTPVGFNDRSNDYQMNQLYLILGRRADLNPCRYGAGGRVDLLYGSDYFFTTANGLETYEDGVDQRWNTTGPRAGGTAALYGLAMPQLYAEFYMPWRCGTTVKVGHFNTILGYESVLAPQNFFYSHSYTMLYGEPKTHTGFLASHRYSPRLTFHAGMTRGWDSWEDPTNRPAFLGGLSWSSLDARTNVCLSVHTGDEDVNGQNNRTSYSLVLLQQLSCRWQYALQHDYGVQNDGALGPQFQFRPARWYGLSQYLFYSMSDVTSLGFRFEWFRDEENSRVLGIPIAGAATGKNYYETTLGLNWHPNNRITVRPEVRWDWSDVTPALGSGMYNDFHDKNQFTFATDLVFVF